MKIIICMKYIHPSIGDENLNCFNPYDLYALHKVIDLKKMFFNVDIKISAVCMGPKQATLMLKKAIALGCDEAYLISDDSFKGADTTVTAYILSEAIKYISLPQIICCGEKTIDSETGFVPALIAQNLGFTYVPKIKEINKINKNIIYLSSEYITKIFLMQVNMPILISFSGIKSNLGVVSLMQQKYANQYSINIIDNYCLKLMKEKIGYDGSKTQILKINELKEERNEIKKIYDIENGLDHLIYNIIKLYNRT